MGVCCGVLCRLLLVVNLSIFSASWLVCLHYHRATLSLLLICLQNNIQAVANALHCQCRQVGQGVIPEDEVCEAAAAE
jgi:hypothetical protein